ncbi:MAG: DMT family transporter [Alphaproteobacteria bacterium]|nr:DMT family transporter [Alphaproteobacteria bacterium]
MSAASFPSARTDEPLHGILLMIASMAVFSAVDCTSKFLAASYHPVMVTWGRQAIQILLLAPIVLWAGPARSLRSAAQGQQILRGLLLIGSTVCFISGLARLPLAEASAIGFVSPMFTTALSIPLLGEKVGVRRWAAMLVGFAGALVVIRPGTAAFDPAALFPVASAAFWAFALIVTRRMSRRDTALTTLVYASVVGLVAASFPLPWYWSMPDPGAVALMAIMGMMSLTGHYLLVTAFERGMVSILAPFSYSQMIWATVFGYLVFDSLPDAWTGVGAAIIIASGIYVWHRERVRHGLAGKET